MKKMIFTVTAFLFMFFANAQPKAKQKQPSQAEMNKMMEDAMNAEGMSKEEQAEMKKMMGEIMPTMMEQKASRADYPAFTSNSDLMPQKNTARINAVSKTPVTQSAMVGYAANLYNKIMAKGTAAEISLVKQLLAKASKPNDISSAAVTAMLQGHAEAAMALSIKAVQLSPANSNYQNNMSALLTQYGYAEQAIPVLQKLRTAFPGNSTVLNNLALAWLSLGEKDSAKLYANGAILVNPLHPEALQCGGLIDEINGGDPIDKYTGAMETAPNDFTGNIIKNKGGSGTLDWEKIRKSIAIYEYFPKNWMQMPAPLSNDVKGYNDDMAMKRAYSEMSTKVSDNIEAMIETLQKDLDQLVDKGETEFVSTMAKETMKGLSFMSKPAVEVLKVLSAYQIQVQLSLADSLTTIVLWKDKIARIKDAEIRKLEEANRKKKNNCEAIKTKLDEIENTYLSTVNTRLGKLLTHNVEEYRQWLNAYITWNWYVAGNVKNMVLIQDLGMTAHLVSTYAEIVSSMEARPEHCGGKVIEVERTIEAPQIPNFTCPAVVSIPSGTEWNQLNQAAKNFDANKYAIKQAAHPIPNVSMAYGVGNMIAQPGIAPFIKTANGSVTPATGGADELTPITQVDQSELTPIPKIPLESLTPLPHIPQGDELTPLPDLRKSQLAKELLKKMMNADCKNVRNSKDVLKEELDKMLKQADLIEELAGYKKQSEEWLEERTKQLRDDAIDALRTLMDDPNPRNFEANNKKAGEVLDIIAKHYPQTLDDVGSLMNFMATQRQKIINQNTAKANGNDILQNGLQPTISSGVQVPGTFTLNKALFK